MSLPACCNVWLNKDLTELAFIPDRSGSMSGIRTRDARQARIPKTRFAWWKEKLEGNAVRDEQKKRELRKLGWRVLTI